MKKILFLLIPAICFSQAGPFGHATPDSSEWVTQYDITQITTDSTWNSVEADTGRFDRIESKSGGTITIVNDVIFNEEVTLNQEVSEQFKTVSDGDTTFISPGTALRSFMIRVNGAEKFSVDSTGKVKITTSGSSIGLSTDGNKTTGNLAQFINDDDGIAGGDSGLVVTKLGAIEAAVDADRTFKFGRALIDSRTSDYMYLSHIDQTSTESYALRQQPTGQTSLNGLLRVEISISNTAKIDMINNKVNITDPTTIAVSGTEIGLSVDGNKTSGNLIDAINDNNGVAGGDSCFSLTSDATVFQNGVNTKKIKVSLVDTGEWTAPTGIVGKGFVYCGVEYATFTFYSDGAVALVAAATGLTSANVGTTDGVDNKLNIYDGGTGIVVENQLGSTLNAMIVLEYITP